MTVQREVQNRTLLALARIQAGRCPGCGRDRHPGLTCDGKTTDQVVRALRGSWLPRRGR